MIELFEFQAEASEAIADRFYRYYENRPVRGTKKNPRTVPFYQALEAITGAGKTAILADAVERIRPLLPVQPFVLWLSKGKVVVAQTYANLQDGGKYRSLIESYSVRLLPEYRTEYATDDTRAYMFFATVGKFNDRERGDRLIFRSDIDNAELSTWDAVKQRENARGIRRPLLVVYDEAQNLSDQQTELLLELEPDAFLVASATMRLPAAFGRVVDELKEEGWSDDTLVTHISAAAVAGSGLIKNELRMGGYQSPMAPTIDDMLVEFGRAQRAAEGERLPFVPKCIYVCKTNIIEGNSLQRDDPNRPFTQREAPPILIWRYLVEEKHVDPASIAVYCRLDFRRDYPSPTSFRLFKGGDDDYDEFVSGGFRHVIFNLSLQEGWDDPSCYFAYVDKSMGSDVQVEQLVGRVLRQPAATRYDSDDLNTAHFYVRVDNKSVFADVVKKVGERLQQDRAEIRFTTYGPGQRPRPEQYMPSEVREVSKVSRDTTDVKEPIQELIDRLPDYRGASEANVRGEGYRALVQQRIGERNSDELEWIAIEHSNPVSARWVFARAVARRFKLALELCASDDPKFDVKLEVGSRAYADVERLAQEVVEAYFEHVRLRLRAPNPYVVGAISAVPSDVRPFSNSLHSGYAGLNSLELSFAEELDGTGLTWCRNPSPSGYGIPLLSEGRTKDFYPDFLVWRGNDVYALDTTGPQLIHERTTRKLLSIDPGRNVNGRFFVRLVSPGRYDQDVRSIGRDGYTIWRLREDGSIGNRFVRSVREAVEMSVREERVH